MKETLSLNSEVAIFLPIIILFSIIFLASFALGESDGHTPLEKLKHKEHKLKEKEKKLKKLEKKLKKH